MFCAKCDGSGGEEENPNDGSGEAVDEEEVVKPHPADHQPRNGQRRNHCSDEHRYLEVVCGKFVSLVGQHLDERHAAVEAESEANLAEESHDTQFCDAVGVSCCHDEIKERGKSERDGLCP